MSFFSWFDRTFNPANYGVAPHEVIERQAPPPPPWMALATREIGVKEIAGPQHAQVILGYFKDSGHSWVKDDETPWCAAFVGAMLERAKVRCSGSLGARSYATWGHEIQPTYGAIGVKRRVGGKPWEGHVGFVVGASPTHIYLLGGNQANMVNIAPFLHQDFLTFRWPNTVAVPERKHLPQMAGGARVTEA